MSNVAADEYASSLSDLTVNSKPLINMLTMLAEDNIEHAPAIVQAVEKHLQQVPSDIKLPVLYLIDSIVKNVGRAYTGLFTQNIVSTFCSVFEKVDERTRAQMFKLRQTWNEVFPAKKLYAVDVRVSSIDPAWPITAPVPTSIHVNPKFFQQQQPAATPVLVQPPAAVEEPPVVSEAKMREQLLKKQKELLELQQKKLELELLQTKAKLEEQQKQLERQTVNAQPEQTQTGRGNLRPLNQETPKKAISNKSDKIVETNAISNKVQQRKPAASHMPRDPRLKPRTAPVGIVASSASSSMNNSSGMNSSATLSTAPTTSFTAVSSITTSATTTITNAKLPDSSEVISVSVTDSLKQVDTAKSKPQITINIGSANKGTINKEPQGVSKNDPRLLSKINAPNFKGKGTVTVTARKGGSKANSSPSRSTKNVPSPRKPPGKGTTDKPDKPTRTRFPVPNIVDITDSVPQKLPDKKENDKAPSPDSPNKKCEKKAEKKTAKSRTKGPVPDLSEPEVASPSPPPPPIINDIKSPTFKNVRGSRKSRNYMNRNRREDSISPARDVDLRLGGPPEKHPRLSPKKPHVDTETKDIDLRQMRSPSKKRLSTERGEQPPPIKKSKAEMIDVLFGNEDVDLRTLVPLTVAQKLPPSPPPPPIISHNSPASSSQDSSTINTISTMPEAEIETKSDQHEIKEKPGPRPKDWAKYKESQPDAYKTPLRFPEAVPEYNRGMHQIARGLSDRPTLDRLGRPLLYHRLPDDPGERRRSLSVTGEDTDMRLPRIEGDSPEEIDLNVNMIIAQAEEQLRSGIISIKEYNTLLKQVIHINEIQKLREAQRRDEQEDKENRGGSRGVRRSGRLDSSPLGDEDNRGSPIGSTRFGDIDERFPPMRKMEHSGHMAPPWNDLPPPRPVWDQQTPWAHQQRGLPPPLPARLSHPQFHRPNDFVPHQPPPPPPSGPPGNFAWRHQFSARAPYEADVDNRFERLPVRRFPRPPVPVQSTQAPSNIQTTALNNNCELPPADPLLLDLIAQDSMRTINIDGIPREIRFYGDAAVVLLAWDDPREISFQGGSRRVVIDDREAIICTFNEGYRDFILDGQPHRVRLGAPTRELYIDGKWYECFFGGPPVNIEIGGKIRKVKLEGPPPQVKIGYVKRTDLVAGKINLIINARTMVPIFLDAKPQRFDIENKPHVLQFVNALTTVLINGRPFKVEFGGLPKPIIVRDKKHFIRFTLLPRGVRPGFVNIINMEGGRLPTPPPRPDTENSSDSCLSGGEDSNSGENQMRKGHDPVLPMLGVRGMRKNHNADQDPPENARNSPNQHSTENSVSTGVAVAAQKSRTGTGQMPLEMLTSLIPSAVAPATGFSYQVEQDSQDDTSMPAAEPTAVTAAHPEASQTNANQGIPFLLPEINVEELFQKLVAKGILPQTETVPADEKKEEDSSIKPVDFSLPETLKVKQPGLVAALYSGIQCSSCGVRFPPEQTMKYSQHLDWHFRQNRRERDNTRKAQSRKWYYDVSDWIQFEEIEDLEERAQSWFETQQASEGRPEEKEIQEIPSVPAESQEEVVCEVCQDRFEQFYNEEREEWHLKMAVRVDGKTYHPLCYEDLQASLDASTEEGIVALQDEGRDEVSEEEKPVVDLEATNVKTEIDVVKQDNGDYVEETIKTEVADNLEEQVEIKSEPFVEEILIKVEPIEEITEEIVESKENLECTTEEEDGQMLAPPVVDTTLAALACSIDGNVQFEDPPTQKNVTSGSKIKINITKQLQPQAVTVASAQEIDMVEEQVAEILPEQHNEILEEVLTEECHVQSNQQQAELIREVPEPPPPGVEPVSLKPLLVGRKMTELPPVARGTELSGLCSIM